MKFTVLGFSQEKLIEMSLDLNDALILRWFVDFYSTGRMHKITAPNGCVFVQVNYKALLDDVPIIGVSSGDVLKRRFNKLVSAGLMEHYTFRSGGTFSCYRLTDEYENLISAPSDSKADCPTQKSEGYDSKVGGGTTQKSEQKNPSIIHPSIKSDLRLGEESADESRGEDKETPPPYPRPFVERVFVR